MMSNHARTYLFGATIIHMCAALTGCAGFAESNWRITGEARVLQVNPYTSTHSTELPNGIQPLHSFAKPVPAQPYYYAAEDTDDPHRQRICIVVNRCFVRYLQEQGKPEVIAYVEVFEGVPEASKPIKRIFFKDLFQPGNAKLNFQDVTIYGPTVFKGQQITLRFYIYEMDTEDNKVGLAVTDAVVKIATTVAGPYGLLADAAGEVVKTLISTNVDDRELYFQVTLFPARDGADSQPVAGSYAPLRTGQYLLIKKELSRYGADAASLVDFLDESNFVPTEKDERPIDTPVFITVDGELRYHGAMDDQFYKPLRDETNARLANVASLARTPEGRRPTDQEERARADAFAIASSELSRNVSKLLEESPVRPGSAADDLLRSNLQPTAPRAPRVPVLAPAAQSASLDLKFYRTYRFKSYLTFTILNNQPPQSIEDLNRAYVNDAEQIEKLLNTEPDAEKLAADIAAIQAKTTKAIIAEIARRKLNTMRNSAERAESLALLKERFPDYGNTIDEVSRLVPLQRAAGIAAVQRQIEDALGTGLNELANLDEKQLNEIGTALAESYPAMKPSFDEMVAGIRNLRRIRGILNSAPPPATQPSGPAGT